MSKVALPSPVWSTNQRHCLAVLGFRHWRARHAVAESAAREGEDAPLFWWPSAARPDGRARLAFVLDPTDARRAHRMLADIARHFSVSLPGAPVAVGADAASRVDLLLGFKDAGESLSGQHTLPALSSLLAGDVAARREAWSVLSSLLGEAAQ